MIAHLPEPYEDELLYSVIARCATHLNETSFRSLAWLFFGAGHVRAQIDLPERLDIVASKVPGHYHDRANQLASELTLLPLFTPFLRPEHRCKIEEAMVYSHGGKNRSIASLGPLKAGQPSALRFCPECWKLDNLTTGERYWRRSHQAPGSFVCHKHETPLWLSPVAWSFRRSWQQYFDASAIRLKKCVRGKIPEDASRMLVAIARDIRWLLSENNYNPGPEMLQCAYFEALSKRGFTHGPFVRWDLLKQYISEKIGPRVLSWITEEIRFSADFGWLERLLHLSKANRAAQPPFRHLLLIQALDQDAKSFFGGMPQLSPLDQTAAVLSSTRASTKAERLSKVRRWWMDDQISVCEMARRLGVSYDTVSLIAAKSGLPFPRVILTCPKVPMNYTRKTPSEQRKEFLHLRARHPHLGLVALTKNGGGLVRWLRRHDWAWLQNNRPKRVENGGAIGVNWSVRDEEFACRLAAFVAATFDGNQVLTVSSVERSLGIRVANTAKKLPKTASLLQSLVRHRSLTKTR